MVSIRFTTRSDDELVVCFRTICSVTASAVANYLVAFGINAVVAGDAIASRASASEAGPLHLGWTDTGHRPTCLSICLEADATEARGLRDKPAIRISQIAGPYNSVCDLSQLYICHSCTIDRGLLVNGLHDIRTELCTDVCRGRFSSWLAVAGFGKLLRRRHDQCIEETAPTLGIMRFVV